jgi:hypothetical protein
MGKGVECLYMPPVLIFGSKDEENCSEVYERLLK